MICCGYNGDFGGPFFVLDPTFVGVDQTASVDVYADNSCGGNPDLVTGYFTTWSSFNTSILTAAQGSFTGVNPGSTLARANATHIPTGDGQDQRLPCPYGPEVGTGHGNVTACQVPTGESTQAIRQTLQGTTTPTSTDFLQTLNFSQTGATDNGATVGESEGSGGTDGCWFSGSALPVFNSVTGSQGWVVGGITPGFTESQVVTPGPGQWGPDEVGWSPTAVVYYQQNRPKVGLSLPCSFNLYQNLSLTCPGKTPVDFVSNAVLTSTIDSSGLTNCREGACTAHIPYQ